MWQNWVNLAVGVWLVASSFVLKGATLPQCNSIVVGIIVGVIALWGIIPRKG